MVSPWETRPPGDVVLTHSFWAAFFRQALGLLVGGNYKSIWLY